MQECAVADFCNPTPSYERKEKDMNKNLILEGNTIYELDPVCMRTKSGLNPTRQQEVCAGCGAHSPEAGSARYRFCKKAAAGMESGSYGKAASSGESEFCGKAAAGIRNPGRPNHKMCPLLGAVILSACCRKTGCANR